MTTLFSHGQTDDLGNGRFRTTLGLKPVNYLSSGVYLPINNNWQDSGDGTYPHLITAAPMLYSSGPTGARRIHPTRELDVYIEVGRIWHRPAGTWVQAPMNALTRNGNRLTSTNTNYDLIINAFGHGLKFDLIRKNGFWPANNTIAFPASLVGLTRVGSTLYKNGVAVAVLRAPIVYDLNDESKTLPIGISFGAFGSQSGVIFSLPTPAQLTTAGIVDPVIDPTLTLQPDATAGLDTYVQEGAADTNFGTATTLSVLTSGGIRRFALLEFDLSSIAGVTITAGTFYAWNVTTTANTWTLARILSANSGWTEAGATWNYAVASSLRWAGDTGADGGTDAGCSVSGTDYSGTNMGSFSVAGGTAADTEHSAALSAAELQLMLAANAGIHLRGSATASRTIHSSDSASALLRPQLVVEYTEAGGFMTTNTGYWGA